MYRGLPVKKAINPYSLIMFNFISKKILDYNIYSLGNPGESCFGIAAVPDRILPGGYASLTGSDDPTSDNYGNYKHTESESTMCWIPKFFYRCEGPIIDISDTRRFKDRETAKNSGYVLHRAFVDGGVEQDGFFIDKYPSGICDPVTSGKPRSADDRMLFYNINPENSGRTFAGDWFPYDKTYAFLYQHAIKVRDTKCSSMSVFNWGAMLMLLLTHGWASTGIENNAWYMEDPLKNHVKGPTIARSNATRKSAEETVSDKTVVTDTYSTPGNLPRSPHNVVTDKNDTTLTYRYWESVYVGTSNKPNDNVAKATHNGQNNGVVGLRTYGRSAYLGCCQIDPNDLDGTSSNPSKKIQFVKESVKMSDLTCVSNYATAYDASENTIYPHTSIDVNIYTDLDTSGYSSDGSIVGFYGNGQNNVFSNDTEGDNWILTGCGIPTPEGISTASNETGQQYYVDSKVNIVCKTNTILNSNVTNVSLGTYGLCNSGSLDPYFIFRGVRYPD